MILVIQFLHAISLACDIDIYLGLFLRRSLWLEPFNVEFIPANVIGSISIYHGIAEEDHIDPDCSYQRSDHERSDHRTYCWHSPWPDGEHARGRIRPYLLSN